MKGQILGSSENLQEPNELIVQPTPAIVLSVGPFAAQAARQVRRIYLRGDTRRAAASAFYEFQSDDEVRLKLVDLDGPTNGELQPEDRPYLERRRAALQSGIQHGQDLKIRLEQILHQQRVHERLIASGWIEPYAAPLNIFILADLTDPWAAGVLLPLGAILNNILANTSLCQAHWLLGIAVFPDGTPNLDLAVWSSLQAFDEFLRPKSDGRERLSKVLGIHITQPPDFAVYLFDSRKEGTAVVKDPASLNTLFGNALLALLQRDLARRFFQERDEDALFERGCFYSSIGAAGLVYDPEALQAACAQRIGYEFLNEKILGDPRDGQAVVQYTHQLQEKLGGTPAWLERLCTPLPPAVGQVRMQTDTQEMTALLTEIHLTAIDYERLNQTPWAEQLQEYQARFEQETLPEVVEKLEQNREELHAHLIEIVQEALDRLPLEASLYPGGLQNASGVLEMLSEAFAKAARDLDRLGKQVQERQSSLAAKFASHCQRMHSLLLGAPSLPGWMRILPAFARQWLAPLYIARRYGVQIYHAQALRDECLALLQQLCGLQIEMQALEHLQGILPDLQKQVQQTLVDLTELREKLEQTARNFTPDWPDFPLAALENGWDSVFRQPVADHSLAEWACEQWRPNLDVLVHTFLAARPLFEDWHTVEMAAITAWVQKQAVMAYQPVWTLDLESIFGLWSRKTLPGKKGEVEEEKPLSGKTISSCMTAAFPPIRPDFDAVGGANGSGITFHGLTYKPEWKLCSLPPIQSGMVQWQPVYTGDPYLALFIQARRSVPLRSLVDSFGQVRLRLEELPDDQRQAYDLLLGVDPARSSTSVNVDPNEPDVVHKTFRWKFQPKGSDKEFEQTIELAVSRSRFEYYRRQPRLNGQWNCYAELEMPEVRDLTAAFPEAARATQMEHF